MNKITNKIFTSKIAKISNTRHLNCLLFKNTFVKKQVFGLEKELFSKSLNLYKNGMIATSIKHYTEENKEKQKLIITNAPIKYYVPSVFQLIANRVKMFFKMKTIDPNFNLVEFMGGCEQAVMSVSKSISKEKFDDLKGLVYSEIIEEIKTNIKKLSREQKTLVAVNKGDIQFTVLYNFEVSEGSSKTFVRISVLFYYAPTVGEIFEKIKKDPSKEFELADELKSKLRNSLAADYKFVREYVPNSEAAPWIISELNHWKPEEWINKKKTFF